MPITRSEIFWIWNVSGYICREYGSYFHSDTVQSIGKYPLELKKYPVHAAVGSAHKFHGPKGTGLLYLNAGGKIEPLIHGGGQERDIRPGTENVAGIVGLAKALEIAAHGMEKHRKQISGLKEKMIRDLKATIPGIAFNGVSGNMEESLYTVLSINLPAQDKKDLVLFKLDLDHISVSGGSACASGALKGSHVINEIHKGAETMTVRFSFSKYNTPDDVDQAVSSLRRILDQVSLTRE
jgi:cysteine desulfurase